MALPTLYYFYDALCGWCFGMSPQMQTLAAQWQGQINVVPMSGGMVTGARIGPATDMAHYIKGAYKRVEQLAGVTFGDAYINGTLDNPNAIFSSIKPGEALTAVKQLAPEKALHFAHAIQDAIFKDGALVDEWDTYYNVALAEGLDVQAFKALVHTDEIGLATRQEFQQAADWGIKGFPSLVFQLGNEYYLVAHGFDTAASISERITRIQAEAAAKTSA